MTEEDYIKHLVTHRWQTVQCTRGVGIEILPTADKLAKIWPLAIKAMRPSDYSDSLPEHLYPIKTFEDFGQLTELKDNQPSYIFVSEQTPSLINDTSIRNWTARLKARGFLILHTLFDGEYQFRMYQKVDGELVTWTQAERVAKSVGVVRLGAFGDLMHASSVLKGLKQEGWHVTLYSQPPGCDIITNDPHIDRLVIQDRDQVRNPELVDYWNYLETQHDRLINLSETMEGAWLPTKAREHIQYNWSYELRKKHLGNVNYLEHAHEVAGVPYKPAIEFYPTESEIDWAKRERARIKAKHVVVWALGGGSVHKTNPHLDTIVSTILGQSNDIHVVLVGGPQEINLQEGWHEHKRVSCRCGNGKQPTDSWSIRQALTFVKHHADLVIGAETGVLNSVSFLPVHKICFLSHSSKANLTRDWLNTTAIEASDEVRKQCNYCCLHRLHDSWNDVKRDPESGTAWCQAKMDAYEIWRAIEKWHKTTDADPFQVKPVIASFEYPTPKVINLL